jgi:uncharacterized Zn-finger protein
LHVTRLDILYPLTAENVSVNRFLCEQDAMEDDGAREKPCPSRKTGTVTEESKKAQLDHNDFIPEEKPDAVQTSLKPFGCETCGKRFSLRGSLRTHEKLHGFRPTYSCDVCGKTFKVASGLKSHASLHSGQKPFHCDVCGKTFTLKGSLKTHSALHFTAQESFPCFICKKTYKGRASLKSHFAMHSGKKSFMCEVCGQQQSQIACRIVPYVYQVCGMSCDVRSHLIQHITICRTICKWRFSLKYFTVEGPYHYQY